MRRHFSTMGLQCVRWQGERQSTSGPVRNQIDGGRVVYIPEVKPSVEKPAIRSHDQPLLEASS